MRLARSVVVSSFVLAGVVLGAACKEPSQIHVVVRTNVPYSDDTRPEGHRVTIGITAGRRDAIETSAFTTQAEGRWGDDGFVGTLTVVPQGDSDGLVALRVVMGVDRDPSTCRSDDSKDCWVSRRSLGFVSGKTLTVPIYLWVACRGTLCTRDTTCNAKNQCVSSELPKEACEGAGGCPLADDPPADAPIMTQRSDGGAAPPSDAGRGSDAATPIDASMDATPDASVPNPDLGATSTYPGENVVGGAIRKLAAGTTHTCALLSTGSMRCWGGVAACVLGSPLGYGDCMSRCNTMGTTGANLPNIVLPHTVVDIVAGDNVSCAHVLDVDDSLVCWGFTSNSSASYGGATAMTLPNENNPITDSVSLLASSGTMLLAKRNGPNLAWFGTDPMRGTAQTFGRSLSLAGQTPTQIASSSTHACAILNTGSTKCWGKNTGGMLGIGDTDDRDPTDATAMNMLPAIDLGAGRIAQRIAVGTSHACAILNTGNVKCWGSNASGQLGIPVDARGAIYDEMGDRLPSVNVGTGRTVRTIAAAGDSTCAILDDNTVKCWGANAVGQLGQGDIVARGRLASDMGNALPAISFGVASVPTRLAMGPRHACVVFTDGRAKCWGENSFGQLGVGTVAQHGHAGSTMGAMLPYVKVPLDPP